MRRCKLQGIVEQLYGSEPREYLAQYGSRGMDPVPVRLYASRVHAGLTVEQMAVALGVHRTTVSRWETGGIHTMSMNHLSAWCRVTGVSYDWLVRNIGHPGRKLDALVGEGRRWIKPHIEPLPDKLGIVSSPWQYREREAARSAGGGPPVR